MTGPYLSFCKSVTDLTMPPLRHDYAEPSWQRGPQYVTHARLRHRAPVVKVKDISYLLKRQAQ